MTAGELIRYLAEYSPDTPVCVNVEDEGDNFTAPIYAISRVVQPDGTYLELLA